MGLFDSIMIDIKCPYCGQTSEMECQTKELKCELNRFHKGDDVDSHKFKFLECIADCRSDECMAESERRSGYRSGFGMTLDVKVKLDNGVVTGSYDIIQSENEFGEIANVKNIGESWKNEDMSSKDMIFELFRVCDSYVEIDCFRDFENEFQEVCLKYGFDSKEIYYSEEFKKRYNDKQ